MLEVPRDFLSRLSRTGAFEMRQQVFVSRVFHKLWFFDACRGSVLCSVFSGSKIRFEDSCQPRKSGSDPRVDRAFRNVEQLGDLSKFQSLGKAKNHDGSQILV